MAAFHVRSSLVVVIDPLAEDVIQMPSAEQNELEQTLVLDRLKEPLDPSVQIWGSYPNDSIGITRAFHETPVELTFVSQ